MTADVSRGIRDRDDTGPDSQQSCAIYGADHLIGDTPLARPAASDQRGQPEILPALPTSATPPLPLSLHRVDEIEGIDLAPSDLVAPSSNRPDVFPSRSAPGPYAAAAWDTLQALPHAGPCHHHPAYPSRRIQIAESPSSQFGRSAVASGGHNHRRHETSVCNYDIKTEPARPIRWAPSFYVSKRGLAAG